MKQEVLKAVVGGRRFGCRLPLPSFTLGFAGFFRGRNHIWRDCSCRGIIDAGESGRETHQVGFQLQRRELSNAQILIADCPVDFNEKLFDRLCVEVTVQGGNDSDVSHQRIRHYARRFRVLAFVGKLCRRDRIVDAVAQAAVAIGRYEQPLLRC